MKIFQSLFIMIFLISFQINASSKSTIKVTGIKMYLMSDDVGGPKQEIWKNKEAIYVGETNGILFVAEIDGPVGTTDAYYECTIKNGYDILFQEKGQLSYINRNGKRNLGFWLNLIDYEYGDISVKVSVFNNGKSSTYTKEFFTWYGD